MNIPFCTHLMQQPFFSSATLWSTIILHNILVISKSALQNVPRPRWGTVLCALAISQYLYPCRQTRTLVTTKVTNIQEHSTYKLFFLHMHCQRKPVEEYVDTRNKRNCLHVAVLTNSTHIYKYSPFTLFSADSCECNINLNHFFHCLRA